MNSFLPIGLEADSLYFLATAILALVVGYFVLRKSLHHDRFAMQVRSLQERRAQLKAELVVPRKRSKKIHSDASIDIIRIIVNKMNLIQRSQVGKINTLLINAGYRSKDAIFIYAFFQLVFPIVALIVSILLTKFDFADPFAGKWNLFIIIAAVLFGLKLPGILVINVRNKRYDTLQGGLSDMLDLMLVCAEAGLSLGAALDRVARELMFSYPEMAEELSLTSIELGFLPDRKKALLNLAERVDIAEIRGITNVLIQTEKYGTPVAQALRVLSSEFRDQRMLRAEQKAARLPALMTVPMIVFILPTLFIVMLAPAIISLIMARL